MPAALSGGMIKRVGIARAIALEPELLFLDEPTAGLDPQASDEFVDLIATLHRALGLTVVMVTHDLDTMVALSTRVAVLADRRVLVGGAGGRGGGRRPSVHPRIFSRPARPARVAGAAAGAPRNTLRGGVGAGTFGTSSGAPCATPGTSGKRHQPRNALDAIRNRRWKINHMHSGLAYSRSALAWLWC